MQKPLIGLLILVLFIVQSCSEATSPITQTTPVLESNAAIATPNTTITSPQITISNVAPATAVVSSTFQDLLGNPLELSAYAGKKVFVNYWATWCAPCIREIPALTKAAAILEPENYVFLLASDETLEKINDFLLDRDFTGNFIKLTTYVGTQGINVMPSSVLYDEKGEVINRWTGAFEWDSPEMLAELRQVP